MRVVIRAFNEDGYHKDIAIMDEQQIRQTDVRTKDGATGSLHSGLIGVGVTIDPSAFPEMVRFEVVIDERGKR